MKHVDVGMVFLKTSHLVTGSIADKLNRHFIKLFCYTVVKESPKEDWILPIGSPSQNN